MSLLDRLERRLRPYAVPHLTLGLIVGQIYVLVMTLLKPGFVEYLLLVPERVLAGELWRPITFFFVPPGFHPVLLLFCWYLFYLMGTSLEGHWGTFRYNVFLFVGWVATVAVSFVTPDVAASNAFLMGSVYLAFAFLAPEFELYVMFIIPVQVRWLALLMWCIYGLTFLMGSWGTRLGILASVSNFFLFFGKELYVRAQGARRRMARQAKQFAATEPEYRHRCTVCGITERTHPKMEFRYCSKCAGALAYCMDHLKTHEHVTAPQQASEPS